jgi:Ca2+-binding EF-hand superfamily protein
MKHFNPLTGLALLTIYTSFSTKSIAHAFISVTPSAKSTPRYLSTPKTFLPNYLSHSTLSSRLRSSPESSSSEKVVDDEVERLLSMAAKLRAEAAALEAEKAQQRADATARAFQQFDTNRDGSVSVKELQGGLEKALRKELDESRVQKLMDQLDRSGDGVLQVDEFVDLETLRNRFDAIIREEQGAAKEALKQAKLEAEAAALLQARRELLNDKEPTTTDKIVSILPYLLPLLDGLQFGRFLLEGQDNPAVAILAILFGLYRSIPFSGFVAFLALSTLSGNLRINRLIRFNMQQAIYLDISLFLPGLIASLQGLITSGLDVKIPEVVSQLGSDAVFLTLLAAIGYSVISSILGITPDKIPFISDTASQRIPTIDMFDADGRFIGRNREDNEDQNKDK